MKGRCIGVSLEKQPKLYNNKKKSLPQKTVTKLETPLCIWKRGSLTVEASLVLPMLACFFSLLLFIFHMLMVQLIVQEALEDTGRMLSVVAEKELSEESQINYGMLAKAMLTTKLAKEEEINRYVVGNAFGVSIAGSKWENDEIVLEVHYMMRFPIGLLGKRYFPISQKTSFRKWTGWHATRECDLHQMTVYITKSGQAFHRRKSCPYLALSIRSISLSSIPYVRNLNGEKYYACEYCGGKKEAVAMVYITDYGTRYHKNRTCSGLKRTIYEVKYNEIGGRHACPKCWK